MDDLGGILVVKASIDGRGPFKLVLDTGAGATVLTPRAFRALRLSAGVSGTASGLGTQTVPEKKIILSRVEVGEAAARNVAAVVIDLPPDLTYQGRYGRIDGILGYTFLKNFIAAIDYQHHTATFSTPGSSPPTRYVSSLPMLPGHSAPEIRGTVAGAPAVLMLDTGNNGISIASARFAHNDPALSQHTCSSAEQTHEGVGGFVSTPLVRARDISVGNSVIHNVALAISHAPEKALASAHSPDVILGNDFLRRFQLVIDYPGRVVYLMPTARADAYKPYLTTGLSLQRRADGTLIVQSISAGSAAAHTRIQVHDEILAINGVPAQQLSDADISRATNSRHVRYEIRSTGRIREVTLALHDALPPCTWSSFTRSNWLRVRFRSPQVGSLRL